MENLLSIIKKAPLVTWKAFLVLWALFLGFADLTIKLTIKILKFVGQFSGGPVSMNTQRSSDDGFWSEEPVVDKVRTYQNGVDGPKCNPGTTFYH